MKYVIVIPDGCADEPQTELGGRTPLQAARTPSMDRLAQLGVVGQANHTPVSLQAGSDVANLSLFGYDPLTNFTGRAPLEAAAQNVRLGDQDWAVRCNLVSIQDQRMQDFTADHIGSDEARELLATAQAAIGIPGIEFVPGVSYRNLMIVRGDQTKCPFSSDTRTTPPHDLTGQSVTDDFPRGPGSQLLCDLMQASEHWFRGHPTNVSRQAAGHLPASHIWLWGLGRRPNLETFQNRFQLNGAMITAVDLLRGLAKLIGWQTIEVPGATGYTDTNYRAKGLAGIEALRSHDVVCVHVEATDEASHEGNLPSKIKALESIDELIVAPIFDYLNRQAEPWRMMVTPDHPTFLRTKTHTHGDVPFVIAGTGLNPDDAREYSEVTAAHSPLRFPNGYQLMPFFLGRQG